MIFAVWRRAPRTALLLALALPGMAGAAEPVQQHNSNAVWFENWIGLSNGQMRVATPSGKIIDVAAERGTPVFMLNPAEAVDGVYRYELRAATDEEMEIVNPIGSGRGEAAGKTMKKPFYTTGFFVVARGVIVTPEQVVEEN